MNLRWGYVPNHNHPFRVMIGSGGIQSNEDLDGMMDPPLCVIMDIAVSYTHQREEHA